MTVHYQWRGKRISPALHGAVELHDNSFDNMYRELLGNLSHREVFAWALEDCGLPPEWRLPQYSRQFLCSELAKRRKRNAVVKRYWELREEDPEKLRKTRTDYFSRDYNKGM